MNQQMADIEDNDNVGLDLIHSSAIELYSCVQWDAGQN
jgi:hypothetical protein